MEHANTAWVAVIGSVAALCTTVAFVPQIAKIRRQGGRDLSWGLLGIYLGGLLLWLGYGLLIGAREVIAANVASAALLGTAIVLKARGERRPAGATRSSIGGRPLPGESSAKRLRIAIDMDDVIADFHAKEERVLRDGRRSAGAAFYEAPGFFADLEVVEGSQEVLRALAEHHEIFIASAAMDVPSSFADKYTWLRRHFAFVPSSHYVFCGDKSILEVDVLIDDRPRHFSGFRGRSLLFSAPHNADEQRYERVGSWAEVGRLLLSAPSAESLTPPAARQ